MCLIAQRARAKPAAYRVGLIGGNVRLHLLRQSPYLLMPPRRWIYITGVIESVAVLYFVSDSRSARLEKRKLTKLHMKCAGARLVLSADSCDCALTDELASSYRPRLPLA